MLTPPRNNLFILLFLLTLFSTHAQPTTATSGGCQFDLTSIQAIESWWNGNTEQQLDETTIKCVSRNIGQAAGSLAGAAGGAHFGSWFGGKVGGMFGQADMGATIGAAWGLNWGLEKGGEIGASWGESLSLASLLGGGTGSGGSGSGGSDGSGSGSDGSQNRWHKQDTKLQMRDKCYKMMRLTRQSNKTEIKSAYRREAKNSHPDKNGGKHDEMVQLNLCYEIVLLANTGSGSRGSSGDL